MATTQAAIARLESGAQSPSVRTLQNFARANGFCLEIGFVRSGGAAKETGCILVIEDFGPRPRARRQSQLPSEERVLPSNTTMPTTCEAVGPETEENGTNNRSNVNGSPSPKSMRINS